MTDEPQHPSRLRVAELPERKPYHFSLKPDAETCAEIARHLDLTALRKLSFVGCVQTEGRQNWQLEGTLGATVVQPCVVSLAPVTTRIDIPVTRRFVKDWSVPIESDEIEMPEDDSTEPLTAEIDLLAVLSEALALAIPDYPRANEAHLKQSNFAAEGVTPMTDEDTKPFAALSSLKSKLEEPDA